MASLIFNGVLIIGLIYLYLMAGQFEYIKVSNEALGPGGFPRLLIICIIVGLVICSVRDILKMKKNKANESEEEKPVPIARQDWLRLGGFFALLIAYLALIQTCGFILCTLVFTFATIKIIGYKKTWLAAVAAVVLTLVITYVFGELFNIALPRGIGFLRELSRYIY